MRPCVQCHVRISDDIQKLELMRSSLEDEPPKPMNYLIALLRYRKRMKRAELLRRHPTI